MDNSELKEAKDWMAKGWSEWLLLDKKNLIRIPKFSGVYEISCQAVLCIVYIGSATGHGGLRQRLGQRINNPKKNLSGYEKQLRKQGCDLMFSYVETGNAAQARYHEPAFINEYKTHHGHLPPGNKVTPHSLPPSASANAKPVNKLSP
ncbi:hypothetical protein ES703_25885 [subsurface metagenome]